MKVERDRKLREKLRDINPYELALRLDALGLKSLASERIPIVL